MVNQQTELPPVPFLSTYWRISPADRLKMCVEQKKAAPRSGAAF
ncbi:MAG: hypothetical protein U9P82_03845 [Bacteroidota bacterium]|nr:hypothetical protein [Bacteroidota bacterium]